MSERYPVVPRGLATQDLRDSAAHFAAEADAATARRFIDAVEQAFELLARQPGIGSPRYAVELDWPGLRTQPVQRFPQLIFYLYLEQTDHLDVLRVGTPTGTSQPASRAQRPTPEAPGSVLSPSTGLLNATSLGSGGQRRD